MKFKIDRYYENIKFNRVYKCIEKEEDIYLFEIINGISFSIARCPNYNKSSRLCKKCTTRTICSKTLYNTANLIEIPRLKAILLYEEI